MRGEGLLTTRGEGLLTDCEGRRAADYERRRAADSLREERLYFFVYQCSIIQSISSNVKVLISNWLLNSKISQLENFKLLKVLVVILLMVTKYSIT